MKPDSPSSLHDHELAQLLRVTRPEVTADPARRESLARELAGRMAESAPVPAWYFAAFAAAWMMFFVIQASSPEPTGGVHRYGVDPIARPSNQTERAFAKALAEILPPSPVPHRAPAPSPTFARLAAMRREADEILGADCTFTIRDQHPATL